MNNKKIGTAFEREFCEKMAAAGYWVHFIEPNKAGGQPFDIIAVKAGEAYAIDCKTCVLDTFNIRRLEFNQISAFDKWIKCLNGDPIIAVEHKGRIYKISYLRLKGSKSVKLTEDLLWDL